MTTQKEFLEKFRANLWSGLNLDPTTKIRFLPQTEQTYERTPSLISLHDSKNVRQPCTCVLCEQEKQDAINELNAMSVVGAFEEQYEISFDLDEPAAPAQPSVLEDLINHRFNHYTDNQHNETEPFYGQTSEMFYFDKYEGDDPLYTMLTTPSAAGLAAYQMIMDGHVPPGTK